MGNCLFCNKTYKKEKISSFTGMDVLKVFYLLSQKYPSYKINSFSDIHPVKISLENNTINIYYNLSDNKVTYIKIFN